MILLVVINVIRHVNHTQELYDGYNFLVSARDPIQSHIAVVSLPSLLRSSQSNDTRWLDVTEKLCAAAYRMSCGLLQEGYVPLTVINNG